MCAEEICGSSLPQELPAKWLWAQRLFEYRAGRIIPGVFFIPYRVKIHFSAWRISSSRSVHSNVVGMGWGWISRTLASSSWFLFLRVIECTVEAFSSCLYIIPHNIRPLLLAGVVGVCNGTLLLIQLLQAIVAYVSSLRVGKPFSPL